MKLHAFDRQRAMAEAHDGVAGGIVGAGGDLEFGGETFFADDERVVAGAGGDGRDAGEEGAAVVLDLTGFAVHELWGADDLAPEGGSDRLVAEADPEYRHEPLLRVLLCPIREVANEIDRDAGVLRGAGAG